MTYCNFEAGEPIGTLLKGQIKASKTGRSSDAEEGKQAARAEGGLRITALRAAGIRMLSKL